MSAESYAELLAAGAPALPEGYAYNVHGYDADGDLRVSIDQAPEDLEYGYWHAIVTVYSFGTGWRWLIFWRRWTVKEDIVHQCKRAHRRAQRYWALRDKRGLIEQWEGRHP